MPSRFVEATESSYFTAPDAEAVRWWFTEANVSVGVNVSLFADVARETARRAARLRGPSAAACALFAAAFAVLLVRAAVSRWMVRRYLREHGRAQKPHAA